MCQLRRWAGCSRRFELTITTETRRERGCCHPRRVLRASVVHPLSVVPPLRQEAAVKKRTWFGLTAGVAVGGLAVAGWRLYRRRSLDASPARRASMIRPRRGLTAGSCDSRRWRCCGDLWHAARDEPGRRRRRGRSRLRPGLSGRRACAPCARTPRDGRGFVRRHVDPGDRQRAAGGRGASDRLPHRRRRRAALSRCFPGPGGEHPVAAPLGRPSPHLQ